MMLSMIIGRSHCSCLSTLSSPMIIIRILLHLQLHLLLFSSSDNDGDGASYGCSAFQLPFYYPSVTTSSTCTQLTRQSSISLSPSSRMPAIIMNTALAVGSWDNDDFLESLSQGGGGGNENESGNTNDQTNDADDIATTNIIAENYAYSYNKNIDAAAAVGTTAADNAANDNDNDTTGTSINLADDYVSKVKAFHNDDMEEASQGGSRFRELIEKAREKHDQQQQQQQIPLPPLQIPPSSIMTEEEIANLSIDEQARLYRELFYVHQHNSNDNNNKENQKSIGSTTDNYLENGVYGFDGKKIGRNRDVETISSEADVYFAKLKRDSTSRNIARYSGDDQTANTILLRDGDPSLFDDITFETNPYLREQQQRMQQEFLETAPEEMVIYQEDTTDTATTHDETTTTATNSGISYKQKLEQKKQEREEMDRRQQ